MLEGPRAAKLEEMPEIIRLANSIFMSRLGVPPMMEELFPQLFSKRNLKNLRVIVEDGRPVSHVGIWEGEILIYGLRFKIGMIGSVYTHPDYRGRGYASALVRDAFSKMRRDGIDFALVSGFRSLYRLAGCVEVGRIYVYSIQRGKLSLGERVVSIVPYKEGQVRELVEIYQKEPVRYQRSLEEFKLLAERGFRCNSADIKIYMAMAEGQPLAYIATGILQIERVIVEYAGPRDIVLHLVDGLSKAMNVDAVNLIVPSHDVEMLHLLEEQGLEKPQSKAPASIALINPRGFLEKVKPYLEERVGKRRSSRFIHDLADKRVKLILGGEEVEVEDPRALSLLFFGPPEKLEGQLQPNVEVKPNLKFLAEALPLPTPIYGLNYI